VKEQVDNLWDIYDAGNWIGVTTNGVVKSDGSAVMGKGIALDAAKRFPNLPKQLAFKLKESGNHVFFFLQYRIVTIPTKDDWKENSKIELIKQSCQELRMFSAGKLYLPPLGCGNGGLLWNDVRAVIAPILDQDWFVVVHRK
jgi:hypothetical protein